MTPESVAAKPAACKGKAAADEWPTFAGDYTSRRYSTLKHINRTNVKNLTLAWTTRVIDGPGNQGGRGGGGGRAVIGGEGKGDFPFSPEGTIKGTPLMVDGTLYVTTPDNGWALDARDGRRERAQQHQRSRLSVLLALHPVGRSERSQ